VHTTPKAGITGTHHSTSKDATKATLHRRQADALIPMAGDAHTGVSQTVQKVVQEVVSWQKRNNTQVIPKKYGDDEEQRNLGMRFAKLLLRRDKSLETSQSRRFVQIITRSKKLN
jgi:hypothetical protein